MIVGDFNINLINYCDDKILVMTNFRHLLHAVPTRSALFKSLSVFSYFKNFEFACCLGGFFVELPYIDQNMPFFGHTVCMLSFQTMPCW